MKHGVLIMSLSLVLGGCKSMSVQQFITKMDKDDERVIRKKNLPRDIKSDLRDFDSPLYVERGSSWPGNLFIGFLEGTKKDTTYTISLVFKDSIFSRIYFTSKTYNIKTSTGKAEYFINNTYDKLDKSTNRVYLVTDTYKPYRTDTLKMKFRPGLAQLQRKDSILLQ